MIEPTTGDGKGHGWTERFGGVPGPRRWPTAVALGLLVGVTALVVGWVLVNGQVGLHREGGRITSVQDFASHARFTRAAWTGELHGPPSLYTVGAHLRFMGKWAGEPVERALPFGYAPTMLWVLGPFSALPLPFAYVLWSLVGLGAAVWIVLHRRVHRLLAVMVFLSPVAVASVALGQTAILSAAGMFFLMDRSLVEPGDRPAAHRGRWLAAAAVLWALGAKPPVALAAGVTLLALHDGRTVLVALALTALSTTLLVPWIGISWPADYLTLLSTYNRTQADPAFAWSLAPALMSNLRAALFVDGGVTDALASGASNFAWALALVAVGWAGWTGRVTRGGVWALAVLSYLLLCSHVTFTENLLLLLVPAAVAPWGEAGDVRWMLAAWVLVALGLVLSPAIGPVAGLRPPPLFLVEILLVAWVLRSTIRPAGFRAPGISGRSLPSHPRP